MGKWAQADMPSSNSDVSIQSLFSMGGLLFLAGTLLLGSYQTMAKMADLGQGQPVATPVAILLMELLKLLVSAKGLTDAMGTDGAIAALKAVEPKDFLMFGVPGLLYAFNNNLEIMALNYMDPATNRLLNNLKIPSTAIIFQIFMAKTISKNQWIALGMLLVGSCLASLSNGNAKGGELYVTTFGVVIMLFYGLVSASASVFNEYIMKQGAGAEQSIHLQNLLLYSWGIALNGTAFLLFSSIFKLFMSACAIFVAGFLQMILLGATSLPFGFIVAACMVSGALYLYNLKPPEPAVLEPAPSEEEMESLA